MLWQQQLSAETHDSLKLVTRVVLPVTWVGAARSVVTCAYSYELLWLVLAPQCVAGTVCCTRMLCGALRYLLCRCLSGAKVPGV